MIEKWMAEWSAWWQTVTPEFAFLLALPLMVAVAGLAGECVRRHRSERDREA